MVQKVSYILVDDIDGKEAVETVTFGLDGVSYEIDLSAANAERLRSAFAEWVGAGRKVTGRRQRAGAGRGRASAPARSGDAAVVRAWANENGYTVSERGRIPAEVRAAYEARH